MRFTFEIYPSGGWLGRWGGGPLRHYDDDGLGNVAGLALSFWWVRVEVLISRDWGSTLKWMLRSREGTR